MLIKKGAMFGLDARIALAIFGALSVISGAALYSAIKDAKATALLTEFSEISKAWEAYYVDTGSMLESYAPTAAATNDDFYRRKLYNLYINPGKQGWSGPYLSDYYESTCRYCHNTKYNAYVGMFIATTDVAWGNTKEWNDAKCSTGRANCFVWLYFRMDDQNYATIIDEKVDGGDGSESGNFRWWEQYNGHVYSLKIAAVDNPVDN